VTFPEQQVQERRRQAL